MELHIKLRRRHTGSGWAPGSVTDILVRTEAVTQTQRPYNEGGTHGLMQLQGRGATLGDARILP